MNNLLGNIENEFINNYKNGTLQHIMITLEEYKNILKMLPELKEEKTKNFYLYISNVEFATLNDEEFKYVCNNCYKIEIINFDYANIEKVEKIYRQINITIELMPKCLNSLNTEQIQKLASSCSYIKYRFDNVYNVDLSRLEILKKGLKESIFSNEDCLTFYHDNSNFKEKDFNKFKLEIEIMKKILKTVNFEKGEFDKVSLLYKILGKKISYANNYYNSKNTSFGSFVNPGEEKYYNLEGIIENQSVCLGFAQILSLALNSIGINCRIVEGETVFNNKHAWNEIQIDGVWYNCDLSYDEKNIKKNKKPLCFLKSDQYLLKKGYKTKKLYNSNQIDSNICQYDFSEEIIKPYFDFYSVCLLIKNNSDFSVDIVKENNFKIKIIKNGTKIEFDVLNQEMLYSFFQELCGNEYFEYLENCVVINNNKIYFDYDEINEYLINYGYSLNDYIINNQVKK